MATATRNGFDGGFLLPHQRTFSSVYNSYLKGYRATWDEAIKHSRTNALAMRRDAFILGCLQERHLQVAQLKWHLEPEDQRDDVQKAVAQELTKVIQATKAWHHFTLQLAEADWYGRYGNQLRWDVKKIGGKPRLCVVDHRPVNGDKIQYGWDGVPRVMVNWEQIEALRERGAVIEGADGGDAKAPGTAGHVLSGSDSGSPLLVLDDPRWRQRFVIHKHLPSDADYFDGEMAGGVHGVGLRSQIYWLWFLRDDFLGTMLNYMKKLGVGGILIFPFPEGDKAAELAAETAAQDVGERTALTLPVRAGSSTNNWQPILLQFNDAGVKAMKELIDDYFERHIERLIIGQTLSSKPSGGGELGSGASSFQKDTKFRILTYDAQNMADTLTSDLVAVAQRWNFPKADFLIRFVFDVPDPGAADKLKGAESLYKMKVPFKAEEVRGAAGLSKPEPDDETVLDQPPPGMPGTPGAVPGALGQPGSGPQQALATHLAPPALAPAAGQNPAIPGAEKLPPHGSPTIPSQEHLAAGAGGADQPASPDANGGSAPTIPGAEHIGQKIIPGQELLKDVGQASEPNEDAQPTIPGAELLAGNAEPSIPGAELLDNQPSAPSDAPQLPGAELLNQSQPVRAPETPVIPGAEHLAQPDEGDDLHAAALELAQALLEGDDDTTAPGISQGALWVAGEIRDEGEQVEALADEVMRLLEESHAST